MHMINIDGKVYNVIHSFVYSGCDIKILIPALPIEYNDKYTIVLDSKELGIAFLYYARDGLLSEGNPFLLKKEDEQKLMTGISDFCMTYAITQFNIYKIEGNYVH